MRIAEMLHAMAAWLESPTNEALLLAEENEDCMKVVAESCVLAAALLKKAAEEVDGMEPATPSAITSESVEEIAALAAALDSSDDPQLKKQASVLDELLLSIAAPPNAYAARMDLQENRLLEIKKRYEEPRKTLHAIEKHDDSVKAIDKSEMTKEYKIHDQPLSTRYCPIHAGVPVARIGEHIWQCPLDKASYNYDTGFELPNGDKVPGGSVDLQTSNSISSVFHAIFDDREGRLATNRV